MQFFKRSSAEKPPHITVQHARALIGSSPLPMAAIGLNGEIVTRNSAWEKMLGSKDRSWLDWIDPTDVGPFRHHLHRLLDDADTSFQVTIRWIQRDGRPILCETDGFRVGGRHDPDAAVILTLVDRSAREELDRQRAESDLIIRLRTGAAQILTRARTVADIWPALLQRVGECGEWDAGILWQSADGGQTIECAASWHNQSPEGQVFLAAISHRKLRAGEGFPAKIWGRQEIGWLPNLALADRSFHTAKADTAGLRSTVCVPLWHEDAMYGVMELLSAEQRDVPEAIAHALDEIGQQISHAIERIDAERPLRSSEAHYRGIAEMAREAIITIDVKSTMVFVNRAAEEIFGYTREEMVGKPLTILIPEALREAHLAGVRRFLDTGSQRIQWANLELPGLRKDGSQITLQVSLAEVGQDGERLFTGFMRDITKQKREESALVYQALHDSLTDLPNRSLLQERLERAIAVSHRHVQPLSLLFMDLDRFKDVNDTFGHHCGDALLKQVSARLMHTLRESDTVARLGGDEFGLLLPSTDERGAILTAKRILSALRASFEIEGHSFDIGASIGIAHFPQHGGDVVTLMRRADVAMYAAKRAASGYAIYTADRDEINSVRLLLTKELRVGIETDQLQLHYQPKVNLTDGRTEHVEALVRWQHPERGLVFPDTFIPLAEESGLIKPLTLWVLNEALRQHREWREQGIDLRVAVNFSARVLHDHDLLDVVTGLLQRWDVEPHWLEVEITESAIMVDPDRAKETLTALHAAGMWTSIDDFGTGHSSLAYLRRLPFDEIKIDKSFVLDMASSRDDASIVRSVVALGHNFDLKVVAEGVDNQRTLDMLRTMQCDIAQGYFLSRPIAPHDLVAWIRQREASLAKAS